MRLRRVAMIAALAVTACGGGKTAAAPTTTTSTPTAVSTSALPTTTTTTAPPTTTTTTEPAAPQPPPYDYSVERVTADDLGASWHEGCPVAPSNLRRLTLTFIGFDDAEHTGQLVVNADVASKVVEAFRRMYVARFPIRKMKPIFTQEEFDDFETPDDNSTGFSCRNAVNSDGPKAWSNHAYGHAIDINPIENPYKDGDRIIPSSGAAYVDRSDVRPGMAVPGSAIVKGVQRHRLGLGRELRGLPALQHQRPLSPAGGRGLPCRHAIPAPV